MKNNCPWWCEVEHVGNEQEQHSLAVDAVGVVTRNFGGKASGEEFDVVRFSDPGSNEEWLFVGGERCGWSVSVESAQRLARAMVFVLTAAQLD